MSRPTNSQNSASEQQYPPIAGGAQKLGESLLADAAYLPEQVARQEKDSVDAWRRMPRAEFEAAVRAL
jgi:hypothetical protein